MKNSIFKSALKMVLLVPLVLGLISLGSMAFAAIVIENQTGTIQITFPNGDVKKFEPGAELPEIPNGSKIEIITGEADISVTEDSTVDVLIGGSTATLANAAKIHLSLLLGPEGTYTGIEVVEGSVSVLNPDGTTQTLGSGETYQAPSEAPVLVSEFQHDPQEEPVGVDPAGTGALGRNEAVEQGVGY